MAVDDEIILKSPIFYNKNILIWGQAVYYEKWLKKGVRFINDLVKNNGEFSAIKSFWKGQEYKLFYNTLGQYNTGQ